MGYSRPSFLIQILWLSGLFTVFHARTSCAETVSTSATIYGPLGLNTLPSARMDESGTVRFNLSVSEPYVHAALGVQISDSLFISLRQSAQAEGLNADVERLYPGLDTKIRLLKEHRFRPEISVGLQSLTGHKRMAGEYLAVSKRIHNFDFTAGLGWGRFGSAGHFDNPLKMLLSHFGGTRALDGENPSGPQHWFTGDKIGAFGGLEYFTPVKGLSLKLGWGADRYAAEKTAFDYRPPAPWSAGVAYHPTSWAHVSLGTLGGEKVTGRVSLSGYLPDWRDRNTQNDGKRKTPLRSFRAGPASPVHMEMSAAKDSILLYNTKYLERSAHAQLELDPHFSAPAQLGRAAVHMANHADPRIEELEITPTLLGLQGPQVRLLRQDFEKTLIHHQGSAEELWHSAEFKMRSANIKRPERHRASEHWSGLKNLNLSLEQHISLAEEDRGILTRTSLIAGTVGPSFLGTLDTGAALRWNATDNLEHLTDIRPRATLPVRSDVDLFAQRSLAVDALYSAFMHSFRPDLHVSLLNGYLEEMYGGLGGEILYRPFGPRFALGAESWLAFKRDPLTALNLGFNGDRVLSGHLNAWYDLPGADVTVKGSIGRYLAEDAGGTLSLVRNFKNGAQLSGFITVSEHTDFDLFGGRTHAAHGLRLNLPLSGYRYMPAGAALRLKAEPFGRDAGQRLKNPLPLYTLTEPFSYAHMVRHWDEIVR